ncbi:DUF6196 family protein [Aquidulcibacter sp.]|uniref:DUF6196 family protein n=1 Tax=Aquidulcibacter sp. TaxID=2052990 RepID=UPI0025BCEDFC|nr:DUF6196 family protein [Aquidulcibacter sp.]MCA3695862.1 hypothetical protein [Aquidulcibacter sp.]
MLVHFSLETRDETHHRLLKVIASAEWQVEPSLYRFVTFTAADFAQSANREALALVRDGEVWSQLVPTQDSTDLEVFKIISFHFEPGLDNSGFLGWLASLIKEKVGTGVVVICGRNDSKGGIYDYWGLPADCSHAAEALLDELQATARAGH